MIIVTGVGRSGTSIATKVLAKIAKCDLGTDAWNEDIRAGLEHPMVVSINSAIIGGQSCGAAFDREKIKDRTDMRYESIQAVMKYLYDHETWIVKDPRFCYSLDVWLDACERRQWYDIYDIDQSFSDLQIIVCTRNIEDVMLSIKDTGAGMPEKKDCNEGEIMQEIFARQTNLARILSHFKKSPYFIQYENFESDVMTIAPLLGFHDRESNQTIINEHFNGTRIRH